MLSIVIPFYNEEYRISQSNRLSDSIKYIQSKITESFELLLIDDGSKDNTACILKDVKRKHSDISIKIISYRTNRGKGFAIKQGVLKAKGNKIITMDADFSIDLTETNRFINELDTCDIVIGTKKHLMTQTHTKQKTPRRILGKGFTLLTNMVLGLNFTDITCGFKGFRADIAKLLFKKQKIYRWTYDSEILFLAKVYGHTVKELPVSWRHIEGSKVSPLRDTLVSVKELVEIIFNHRYGKYD